MTTLPPCRFRGQQFADPYTGQPRFPCPHPLVRGPDPAASVSERFCSECSFPVWDLPTITARYSQGVDLQPTEEEYSTRAATCDACPSRIDNFCPRAGGTCNLAQKIGKGSFCCPIGSFGAIER